MFAPVEPVEGIPVEFLGLDRIDEFGEVPREPDGVGRACRSDQRAFRVDVEDHLRQAVSPGENEAAEFDEPCRSGKRRREVEDRRHLGVEEAAVVVGLAERPDHRQDRRTAAEQIDEFRTQHAGGAPGRHEDRNTGQCQRLRRIVAEARGQLAIAEPFRDRPQKGQASWNREDVRMSGHLIPPAGSGGSQPRPPLWLPASRR